MSEAELLTVLLRATAEDLPGGPLTPPGPEFIDRARRRFVRRRTAIVAGTAIAILAVSVPLGLTAQGKPGTDRPQPAAPSPYPTSGPGTAAALAHDVWTDLPPAPLTAREDAASAWSGSEMLIWGGYGGSHGQTAYADGAAYTPVTRTWRMLPAAPLAARMEMAAAWTGRELVIWGGSSTTTPPVAFDDGAAYDPATNRWRLIARAPLTARRGAQAMWVDGRLFVLGGQPAMLTSTDRVFFDGAAYDPRTDAWQRVPAVPATRDEADDDLFAAAGGGHLFVLTRWHHGEPLGDGGTALKGGLHFWGYDIKRHRWGTLTAPPAGAGVHQLLWTGREIVVPADPFYIYGAHGPAQTGLHGNRYDPRTRRWTAVPHGPADDLRGNSIWTGALLTFNTGTYTSSGSRFTLPGNAAAWDPTGRNWEPLPNAGRAAMYPAAVWTGQQLLVWGQMNTVSGAGPQVGPAAMHGLAFGPPATAPTAGALKTPAATELDVTSWPATTRVRPKGFEPLTS